MVSGVDDVEFAGSIEPLLGSNDKTDRAVGDDGDPISCEKAI